jgi:hypothetical protein
MVFCFCIMCCFDTLMLDVHILPLLQYHHAHPSCQIARKIDYGTIRYFILSQRISDKKYYGINIIIYFENVSYVSTYEGMDSKPPTNNT